MWRQEKCDKESMTNATEKNCVLCLSSFASTDVVVPRWRNDILTTCTPKYLCILEYRSFYQARTHPSFGSSRFRLGVSSVTAQSLTLTHFFVSTNKRSSLVISFGSCKCKWECSAWKSSLISLVNWTSLLGHVPTLVCWMFFLWNRRVYPLLFF